MRERTAAVLAGGRQGSGYLLTPRLVLTAAHVVDHDRARAAGATRAVVPGGRGETPCDIVWSAHDVALLLACGDLVRPGDSARFTPLRWGVTSSLDPLPDCQAVGFPRAQRDADGRLESEQLIGTLKPGSGMIRGRYVLDSAHGAPVVGGGGSPWAGMSGAAVFSGDALVGVVSTDPHHWQHSRVEAVPVGTLLNSDGFRDALREHRAVGSVHELSTAPADPDAAFEARYREYVAAKHSTLTIYGIDLHGPSRAAWPLDTAYLSLEATAPEHSPVPSGSFPDSGGAPAAGSSGPGAPRPADQVLEHHDRVLLRGAAGSGKTTLVQWLAVTAAREGRARGGGRVPFVLPLRTLCRGGAPLPSPDGFLAAVRTPFAAAQPPGWADRVLSAGRGLLLVDGLDEIGERERGQAREWLRDLLIACPGNRWLVTSRPSAVTGSWLAGEGFTDLTLSPMGRADVVSFVGRWHDAARAGCDDPEELERLDGYRRSLTEAVRTQPDLGRLATNPLMCGLVCALHRDRRGYLPHGRKELYDAALSMLLSRRDRERDIGSPDGIQLSEEPQVQLLQKLAYWLIRNGRAEMDREDALDLVGAALPAMPHVAAQGDAEQVLRHLLVRSGLLREPVEGAVDFVHRTFQDYLGAKAAVEERDFDLMVRNAHHDQWEDVLRMAVGHARPAERARLLKKLVARGDKVKTHRARLHLLALACLEHATELDPAVRALVEDRASALIPPRSVEEARALASLGPVVLGLLPGPEGLTDDEAHAVVVAASLIPSEAAIPLLARYTDHPHVRVRAQLTHAWSRYETGLYAQEVISRLRQDGLYFTAESEEELRLLAGMGGRAWMQVGGPLPPGVLKRYLDPGLVEQLVLHNNPALKDLGFLVGLPRLRMLGLYFCPGVEDLTPLGPLGPESLELLEAGGDLTGLDSLDSLTNLVIAQPLPPKGLDALPRNAPLTTLVLRRVSGGELAGIGAFSSLEGLSLGSGGEQLAASDWQGLARLPLLSFLSLRIQLPRGETSLPPLPTVRTLFLHDVDEDGDLPLLPRLFPALSRLEVPPESVSRAREDLPGTEVTALQD
ncbi:NACHT domain-containing protein [Streptomyces sp. HB2AG]|uniref:NACHT domain-containing protein n=1 Tax=Streptomyces sp. HB2AG TaxID=2983400 RepID=UPI0022AA1E47|nr:NACHT domain-containing protein [Streptomyces sp. HB2AG]MCZ2526795.1 NACHT domain-containing protein [Streptomyces sp. HB2AG]